MAERRALLHRKNYFSHICKQVLHSPGVVGLHRCERRWLSNQVSQALSCDSWVLSSNDSTDDGHPVKSLGGRLRLVQNALHIGFVDTANGNGCNFTVACGKVVQDLLGALGSDY